MPKRTRKKLSGKNAVVPLEEVRARLAVMNAICREHDKGPGTVEYSMKCRLAALNGNWPRIKRRVWQALESDYADLMLENLHEFHRKIFE